MQRRCFPTPRRFPTPDWRQTASLIIDIHTHTSPGSDDSLVGVEHLIREAKRIGLDGLCITEHDRFWDPEMTEELSMQHDLLVLPGSEVTTNEGHLLVYGLSEYVFGMHRASLVKELVDDSGGAIVVAHAYRRTYRDGDDSPSAYEEMLDRACENSVFSLADAVEVMNGRGKGQENAFSQAIAGRFGLPRTGASDAHRAEDLGTFATEFDRPVARLQDFIDELKAGRFRPVALNRPSPR